VFEEAILVTLIATTNTLGTLEYAAMERVVSLV
jgi:hypothetical protein